MNDSTKKQTNVILEYMERNGSITQADAIKLGVYRLASRIWDLREQGHHIISSNEEVAKRDGTKTRIARYSIVKG